MENLEARAVAPAEQDLFRSLYALYLHDLSEFTDFYRLGADGRWSPDYLPTWLDRDNPLVHPFLFWLDGLPVGFALIGAKPFPHMSPEADFRLSEFFILRAHRRGGLGARAATALFARFHGRWEIAQLPANRPATAFWLAVVSRYSGGDFEALTLDGDSVQRFVSRPR